MARKKTPPQTFDEAAFLTLIADIRPLIQQIQARIQQTYPEGVPSYTALPDAFLDSLDLGDDGLSDLWDFFSSLREDPFRYLPPPPPPTAR